MEKNVCPLDSVTSHSTCKDLNLAKCLRAFLHNKMKILKQKKLTTWKSNGIFSDNSTVSIRKELC